MPSRTYYNRKKQGGKYVSGKSSQGRFHRRYDRQYDKPYQDLDDPQGVEQV